MSDIRSTEDKERNSMNAILRPKGGIFAARCLALAVFLPGVAHAAGFEITIPDPANGTLETTETAITVKGYATESPPYKLDQIVWENGATGDSGFAKGATNDWMNFTWQADVPLEIGINDITVTAQSVDGDTESRELLVQRIQQTLPPGLEEKPLITDVSKVKFTVVTSGDDVGGDAASVVSYFDSDGFEMPFSKDVLVIFGIRDPNDSNVAIEAFRQLIPADTVRLGQKYRYSAGPGGIRKLWFQQASGGRVKVYFYVEGRNTTASIRVDFFAGLRQYFIDNDYAGLSYQENYKKWLSEVKLMDVSVQVGETTYRGTMPFGDFVVRSNSVQLLHNR